MIDEDVAHIIKTGWLKWRSVNGVSCDRTIHTKVKGMFYSYKTDTVIWE